MSRKASKKNIQFDERTDIQKQCRPPYKNPIFIKDELPIFTYTGKFITKKPNTNCLDQSAPYLSWNSDMRKYCCAPQEDELTDVMQKIIDAIITQVENSYDQKILNKYKQHIDILIRNYLKLYEIFLKKQGKTNIAEIKETLDQIRLELVTYTSNVRPLGDQSESHDIGEDDEELMGQLRLAESHAPREKSRSEFFATDGGSNNSKISRKQRRNNKT